MRDSNAPEQIEPEKFGTAVKQGTITDESGYHQPDKNTYSCDCERTTPNGAYRDVDVAMPDGRTIHFYHQSPVVVEHNGQYRLDSCDHESQTTKERINRYLPAGYKVRQINKVWYVETPGGRVTFHDGMVIMPAVRRATATTDAWRARV